MERLPESAETQAEAVVAGRSHHTHHH